MDYVTAKIVEKGKNLSDEVSKILVNFLSESLDSFIPLTKYLKSKKSKAEKTNSFEFNIPNDKYFRFMYADIYDLLHYLIVNIFGKVLSDKYDDSTRNYLTNICSDVKRNFKNVYFYDDPDQAFCNIILTSLFINSGYKFAGSLVLGEP